MSLKWSTVANALKMRGSSPKGADYLCLSAWGIMDLGFKARIWVLGLGYLSWCWYLSFGSRIHIVQSLWLGMILNMLW